VAMGGSNETPWRIPNGSVKVGVTVVQRNGGVKAGLGEGSSAGLSGVGWRMGGGERISRETGSAAGERSQPSASWERSGLG
jgi:hypothetical protein